MPPRIKHSLSIVALMLLGVVLLRGQAPNKNPILAFQYRIQQEDGANASAVAWDGERNIYATLLAGNPAFPMETFGQDGSPVWQGKAGTDMRGLWYDPKAKVFEGNGYGEYGWIRWKTEPDNSLSTPRAGSKGTHQPNSQAVGCYDADQKQVVFLNSDNGSLLGYSRKNPKKTTKIALEWKDASLADVNRTTVGYTGSKGYEFVLLDVKQSRLLFFSRIGKLSAKADLPDGASLNAAFCFAFANGHAFLYDKESRTWQAYKVF